MKIIVTHTSPDLDAISSVWLLKRFLPGWQDASVQFVPAGERLGKGKWEPPTDGNPVEPIEENEVIHVDTGLGPLDHHQTNDENVCAASLTWKYVQKENSDFKNPATDRMVVKKEAIERIIGVVVAIDHFKEVFWPEPTADYQEFSLFGLLEGLKIAKPNQDTLYLDFGMESFDLILHNFENRIWAEREIAENGKVFESTFGKCIGFETINDTVLKLAQKMGYQLVIRKDPRKGYVRIKARPSSGDQRSEVGGQKKDIDLTPVYEKLKEMDSGATWFLHVSKKMLLNGTAKNPKMKSTKLSLDDIIEVIKRV